MSDRYLRSVSKALNAWRRGKSRQNLKQLRERELSLELSLRLDFANRLGGYSREFLQEFTGLNARQVSGRIASARVHTERLLNEGTDGWAEF